MNATLTDQTGRKKRPEPSAEAKAAAELVRAAKEQVSGVSRWRCGMRRASFGW